MQAKNSETFKVLGSQKKKKNQPRILYPVKLSFKVKKIKIFSDKQILRKFVASRPTLQEMLKEVLEREEKLYRSKTQIYIKKEHQRRTK